MDTAYAAVTAIGHDRVGIVRDITAVLEEFGCNIEESRMAVLGGEFAVILLASGEPSAVEDLGRRTSELGERLGLHLWVNPTRAPVASGQGRPYVLASLSLDAPGIVHALADLLKSYGVSVEAMETETASAPWTGAPMFRMRAEVVVPPGASVADLRRDLAEIERERDLDITFTAAELS